MSGSDDDEELKRAIALSLEDIAPPEEESSIVDLVSSDEEEDDLDAPVVARPVKPLNKIIPKAGRIKGTPIINLAEDEEDKIVDVNNRFTQNEKSTARENPFTTVQPPTETPSDQAHGILGMFDRKQMEEGRLARAQRKKEQMEAASSSDPSRKRKATSPPSESETRNGGQPMTKSTLPLLSQSSAFRRNNNSMTGGKKERSLPSREKMYDPPSKNGGTIRPSQTPTPNSDIRRPGPGKKGDVGEVPEILSYGDQQKDSSGIQYARGVVKKTWVYGSPRLGDDIKIEEILQKDVLDHAVLSAFQIDPDWIGAKLDDKTKVIWVLQAKTDAEVGYECLVSEKRLASDIIRHTSGFSRC
jgi:hypothetical protein